MNHCMLASTFREDDGGVGRSPGLFFKLVRPSLFPSVLARSRVSNPLLPMELTEVNRVADVTLFARRLRYFAGPRYAVCMRRRGRG